MRIHRVLGFAFATALLAAGGGAVAAPLQGPVGSSVLHPPFPYAGAAHEVYGVVRAINGTTLTVQTRRGQMISVDASWATREGLVAPIFVPRPVIVHGVFVKNTLVAHDVARNNQPNPAVWPADR